MSGAGRLSLTKSNRPVFTNVAGLVDRIGSEDVLGVGGHHFGRLPIAVLLELARRGPRRLKYVSWAGGLPLELLLEADAVAAIDLCFSSLDVFGLPPLFRSVAEAGAIPVRDWTALAMIQALRAAQQNLPSLPFQLPVGSDMMARIPGARITTDPIDRVQVGVAPALRLDTFLLHAQRADEQGNVQILGPRALDFAMAGAAAKVLVTVEEIVPAGGLASAGRQSVLLRNQVTAIAQCRGGAWPASCLPFNVTHYGAIAEALAAPAGRLVAKLAALVAGRDDFAERAATLKADRVSSFPAPALANDPGASVDEIMAARIAAELDDDCFVSAGAVSPLANVAYRLAKATHAPHMIVATMSCGHLDVAPSPMVLSLVESLDAETAAAHAGGDDTYSAFYQAGAVTHEVVGAAQVDRRGRVNNLALRKPNGAPIRLSGQGGMADVANMHRHSILYVPRHSPLSLVETVEIASSARGLLGPAERVRAGYRPGRSLVVTDLCVFLQNQETGFLEVIETMPGVTRARVLESTGFEIRFSADCAETRAPEREILDALRATIDPFGLRRLEFVSARERGALIAEIVAADRAYVQSLLENAQRGRMR